MDPKYIEVWGKFTPRGGISIDPYYNYGRPKTKYENMAEQRLLIMIYILKTLIIVNLMMKVLMRIMDFFLVKK